MAFYHESTRRWSAVLIAVITALLLGAAGKPQAAKSTTTTAQVTFVGTSSQGGCVGGYNPGFCGDGHPYVNGQLGVDAQFNVSGDGNLNLNLINSTRKFGGTYLPVACNAATGPCPQPNPATGTYSFADGWFVTIRQISDMYPGETRWTQAIFTAAFGAKLTRSGGYLSFWNFLWCNDGSGYTPPAGVSIAPPANWCDGLHSDGSQMVSVMRNLNEVDSSGHPNWIVSNSLTAGTPIGPTSEMKELEYKQPNNNPTVTLHGEYGAGFQLTIVCTSGCAALPFP